MTPKERDVMQQALEALEELFHSNSTKVAVEKYNTAHNALREALAEEKESMPITDDNGKAIRPQYRVIEQIGKWFLLYDQHQIGDRVEHEFRIQKVTHDLFLYRGITLENAKAIFMAKVEGDDE